MASKATGRDPLVGEVGRLPRRGDVASFTVVADWNVIGILARGDSAVVADRAAVEDTVMRERRWLPGLRGVANITVLPRDEVGRTLAGGLHIIMTTSTTAEHLAVVKFHCRLERLRRMAALATVGTENVGTVLRGCRNTATALVAADAGARRTLEYGIDVTALARHFVVLANEFKPGSEVVEGAAYLRRGGRAPP